MKSLPRATDLLDFMLLYAKHYLASGGPTSRLEDNLARIGDLFGKHTEVFATPTGIFVTLQDPSRETDPKTALLRIREAGTDLGRLSKLEQILDEVAEGRTSIHAGLEALKDQALVRNNYLPWHSATAAFFAGFAISFDAYQQLIAAIGSGIITASIWLSSTLFLKRHLNNPIFTDFIGAFFTLTLAALAHGLVAPVSIEAYALGGIVLLVPGLALTTAIAELAEQNLVSGTAKFMQATLALLALGLAYLLFQQLSFSLQLREVLQPAIPKMRELWISILAILLTVSCFGVIFKVPPKALIWSTLTGFSGWMMLSAVSDTRAAAAGPFLASVIVGMVSLGFGRLFRQPSQVFSVPGIVAMLPGMLALSSFRYFATGDQDSGIALSFKVAITAVSIVFGLMTARIPFQIENRYRRTVVASFQRVWK